MPAPAPEQRLPTSLAPAAFAAPERTVSRVAMPDNLLDPQQEAALAAKLDQFYARNGLNLYVVYGETDSQITAEALKLELQRGNTALLTVLSNGEPSLILGIPLREKVDSDRVRSEVNDLWSQQVAAGFRLQQQILSVADLIIANVTTPLPLPDSANPEIAETEEPAPTQAAQNPAPDSSATAPASDSTQSQVAQNQATNADNQDGATNFVSQVLRVAVISIIFLLIAAGGGFALLNLYRPVKASPETEKRAAQRAQHEQKRTNAERQRHRQIEQEKRKVVLERRKQRVEKTMRDTQKLIESATKKLTGAIPAPPNSRLAAYEERSNTPQLCPRNPGENFEEWLWRSLKDFNRMHYGRMADNLTPQKEFQLRNHGFLEALDELARFFELRQDEARQEKDEKGRQQFEERFGLVKNYSATLKRTAPNLRKHVMGGVESFLRECQDAGLIPKAGAGKRPR